MKGKLLAGLTCGVMMVGTAGMANAYNWMTYNGHEYSFTENYGNWLAEEAEAVAQGGHLVTINGAAENEWVASTFQNTHVQAFPNDPMNSLFNIGYFFDPSSQGWKWISGEPVTYTNLYWEWNGYNGQHAYMHTGLHPSPGTWNHNNIYEVEGLHALGVIERSTDSVPEPATMLLFGAGLAGLAVVRRKKTV